MAATASHRPMIAIIEDDEATLNMLDDIFQSVGYRTLLVPEGKDAHQLIRRVKADLVLLDLWLEHPDAAGMVLGLLELDLVTRAIPVIVTSANTRTLRQMAPALQAKGHCVLEKPFDMANLLATVAAMLAAREGTMLAPD